MVASCTIDIFLQTKWSAGFFVFGRYGMNDYLTIQQVAEKWNISVRRVNTLCNEGRIEGAIKFGKAWAIPNNIEKPLDERRKTNK